MEYLTLGHYKEPLLPLKEHEGFGYYGALSGTLDGEKVQCHICGNLFKFLGGHVRQKHHLHPVEYRERFKLAYTTSLTSEAERERRKQNMLAWLATKPVQVTKNYKSLKAASEASIKKNTGTEGKTLRLETLNKRGTCPDQLLAKIQEVKNKLGYVPSLKKFVEECGGQRYKHLIFKVYGSWNNALTKLNLPIKPSANDIRYTKEELLQALREFHANTHNTPTKTDSVRGLLPGYSSYFRHFGGMKKARIAAGIN